jgi:hypothetical protein
VRVLGNEPGTLRRGSTVRLAWAPADAHVLARHDHDP